MTGLLVGLGAAFGTHFVHQRGSPPNIDADFCKRLATTWDGGWYASIVDRGYYYDYHGQSSVVFFPAYPLAARWLMRATGLPPAVALLAISNACFLCAGVVLLGYVRCRTDAPEAGIAPFALLSLCFFPFGLYFRMAYTESLFLLLTLLMLYGMERRWPVLVLAALIGLATATRGVGVCLIPVLLLYLWEQGRSWNEFLRSLGWLSLSCWGIVAHMAYTWWTFGDILAFAHAEAHWGRSGFLWHEKWIALATLRPLWDIFPLSSHISWKEQVFSAAIANRLAFVTVLLLLGLGAWKRWLTRRELLLAVGLLGLAYTGRGYECRMGGMGRFCCVVAPIYLVCGRLLARLPVAVTGPLLGLAAFLLGIFEALFIAWWPFV